MEIKAEEPSFPGCGGARSRYWYRAFLQTEQSSEQYCMKNVLFFKKMKEVMARLLGRDAVSVTENPYRGWAYIVTAFLVAVLFFVFGGLYLFVRIKSGEIFISPEQAETRPIIDRARLDAVIELNSAKEEAIQDLLKNRPSFIDPSR